MPNTPPGRKKLNTPRGVLLRVGVSSSCPALSVVVVHEELEVGGLRTKVV